MVLSQILIKISQNWQKKKDKIKVDFSDKHLKHKDVLKVDLNKNINLKKIIMMLYFFNVLEHLTEINNARDEIYKIMKKKVD